MTGGGGLAGVVGDEDQLLAGGEQLTQRLGRARDRLAADPDDPVEVDQKSIEVVRQRHAGQASGWSRYGAGE